MATEFADQKIRIAVNSICPGYFPSESESTRAEVWLSDAETRSSLALQ